MRPTILAFARPIERLGAIIAEEFSKASQLFGFRLEHADIHHQPRRTPTFLRTQKRSLGLVLSQPGAHIGSPWIKSLIWVTVAVLAIQPQVPATAAEDPRSEASELNQQAEALYLQHRFGEAEPLFERALTIQRKTLGSGHPDVAETLNNLGALYWAERRYNDAEPLLQRALVIRQKALGPDDINVARSLNNLARLYEEQGRYQDAEPLYRRALVIRQRNLGRDDLEVAQSLNNLAALLDSQARYGEAEPLYRRALAIRQKVLGPDALAVGLSLNNLAELYRAQGRFRAAELLYRRALDLRERNLGADHPDVAQSLNNLAALYREQGRYGEAELLFRRALVVREKVLDPDDPAIEPSLNNLAELFRAQGRYSEAEPLYRRALAMTEKAHGPGHPDVALSLNNLAALLNEQARYAEAEPLYWRALSIQEKALGLKHPDVALTLNNLGEIYRRQGHYSEAEPLYRRALTIAEETLGTKHPDVALTLNNLAELYRVQGRCREAEPIYRRALAIQERTLGQNHPEVATTLNNLARLYEARGRIEAALTTSARAASIIYNHLATGTPQRFVGGESEARRDRIYFINYIRIADAAAAARPDRRARLTAEAFRMVQLVHASRAAQAVASMAARFAAGNDALGAVVRQRQDLAGRLERLDNDVVKVASRPSTERNSTTEAQLHHAIEGVIRQLGEFDARIANEFPRYAELSNPKPISEKATQRLLAPDEALLVYLTSADGSWLWAVRSNSVGFYRLEIDAKRLAEEVTSLRASLDPEHNVDRAPFPAGRAYALFQKLLAPAAPELTGVRRIIIVPDRALQSLPPGVLVLRPPEHDPVTLADHREIAWLAHDYAVTILPSVSSLEALRPFAATSRAVAPFLGVGDPVLHPPTLASLYDGATLALRPLPETADELRTIARTLGARETDLLLGERASEAMLRQMPLDRYRVIDFATHGLLSGEFGLTEPALVLTPPAKVTQDNDGLLTASKIATLKLNADWVVLSACNTAAGDGTPDGDGLSGLAKAFFYAGARSLLVSHWPVSSTATVKLTIGAFVELAEDPTIGRAEALRRSMMAMLDPANPPEFAHPLYWAPFVLAGEGGAER